MKVCEDFNENMTIAFDTYLGKCSIKTHIVLKYRFVCRVFLNVTKLTCVTFKY